MQGLLRWSYKHPLWVICLLLVVSVLLIPNALKLTIDTSSESMMADKGNALSFYHDTVDTFSSDSVVVIYVDDAALFTLAKLERIQDLLDELGEMNYVEKIESIFSEPCIRNEDGFIETGPLFDYFPETDEECEEIRTKAIANPIFLHNFISENGEQLAINIFLRKDADEPVPLVDVADEVEAILQPYRSDFREIFQMGMPYTWQIVNQYLKRDLMILIPISVGILLLMLMLMLRSINGAILPLLTSGISVAWTYGFMGLVGIPLNILTLIVPSLIIVLGSTEDIHLLAEFKEGLKQTRDKNKAIEFMISHVGTPLLLTALTTFLGFLSIALNEIEMLRMFSYAAAFGLLVNPLITVLLTPVYLRFFGGRASKDLPLEETSAQAKEVSSKPLLIERFHHFIITHRKSIIAPMLAIMGLAGLVGTGTKVDNNILGYFKDSAPIIERFNILHDHLSGAQTFFIRISSGLPGTFKEPNNLKEVDAFQKAIMASGELDQTISLVDYLKLIHSQMSEGETADNVLPESSALISQYLLFLERGNIERYVSADFSELNLVVRHAITSSHELNVLMDECREAAKQNLNLHFKVAFTGENLLVNEAAESIAVGQVKGILLLLAVIFILMAIMFVNYKAAFLSLIPNLFPVAVLFGFMALFGIRLNPGSCMVAAIAIGLALDNTIHFMVRYSKEMRVLKSESKAIESCLKAEVSPILTTSVALVLGFASLSLSNFVPVELFGSLSAFVMLFALIADFCLTPLLLSSVKLLTIWDIITLDFKSNVVLKSELFNTLKLRQIKKSILLGNIIKKKAGDYIYREGEDGGSMFFVLEGSVRTFEGADEEAKENSFALAMPSDVFGELYLLDESHRCENAIAEEPVRCVEFCRADLRRLHRLYPHTASTFYQNLARILGNDLMVAQLMNNALKQKLNETSPEN